MENCGRKLLGQYCHHLHHRHEHGGTFIGVALQHSVSKGFTIHGTSNALIQSATILNHRGSGIYLEVSITILTQSLTLLSTKHGFQLDNVCGFLWPNGWHHPVWAHLHSTLIYDTVWRTDPVSAVRGRTGRSTIIT